MIPTDFKQAIARQLREHFETQLAVGLRRVGAYHRVGSGDFARAVEDCLAGCLPRYLEGAEREAAKAGLAEADWSNARFSIYLPTVETELDDSGRGMSAAEVRQLVAAAVRAVVQKPAKTKQIAVRRNADGSSTATIRELDS